VFVIKDVMVFNVIVKSGLKMRFYENESHKSSQIGVFRQISH